MISGSTTLGEVRRSLLGLREIDPILGMVRLGRMLRIRFLWTHTGEELPDSAVMAEFRQLAALGLARLVIDDQGGGIPVRTPEMVT